LTFGNVAVNTSTYSVSVDGEPIDLTFNEFELLRLLYREPNRVIDYDTLCESLWSSKGAKERRRLSVAVCRLRAKLARSEPYKVETVRARGYGFISSLPQTTADGRQPLAAESAVSPA
jgi:DNA-binding response OmpR family regulator